MKHVWMLIPLRNGYRLLQLFIVYIMYFKIDIIYVTQHEHRLSLRSTPSSINISVIIMSVNNTCPNVIVEFCTNVIVELQRDVK